MAPIKSGNGNGNGYSASLTNIVAVLSIVAILFGAIWVVFLGLHNDLKEVVAANKAESDKNDSEIKLEMQRIHAELRERRAEFVTEPEFRQFEIRFESIIERLRVVEGEQLLRGKAMAHNPVEKDTLDVINASIDRRVAALQAQVDDLNRQIAAAIIIKNQSPIRNDGAK